MERQLKNRFLPEFRCRLHPASPSTLFSPIFSLAREKMGPSETTSSCKFDTTSQSPSAPAPLRGEPLHKGALVGLCGKAGVMISLQAGRKEGLRVRFLADERQLLFPRQLLDQRLEPCGGRVIHRLPESRERLRRPLLFRLAGKDRGEKGRWVTFGASCV